MGALQIIPLSTDSIVQWLELQRALAGSGETAAKVEMWIPYDDGTERHVVGHCEALSERSVAVRCNERVEVGSSMPIAIINQQDGGLFGKGTVRQCIQSGAEYLVGFELLPERRSSARPAPTAVRRRREAVVGWPQLTLVERTAHAGDSEAA